MSEENVEVVRRGYEHFAQTGEADATIYSPDVEWHSAAEDPYAEPFHGVEGVRRLIQEVRDSLDGFRTEPFEYLDGGDFVVAGLTHRGRGKGSDAEVEMREWNVFLIERGKIVSVHEYSDREAALRAAGLSEQAMSEENVALARKAIDALNRGDFDALLAFLSPDVVWEALEGVPGIGELYRGRAGAREWIELMWENAEEGVHIEIEQITDLGDDRVFIAVVITARRRGSGVPFEYRTWQIVWFANGLITRRQVFWTRAEALKTAGLRE